MEEYPMNALVSAAELAARNPMRFPNESADYRRARQSLLAEEIELRRHIERVAELRRALPPGGSARRCSATRSICRRNSISSASKACRARR